MATESFLSSPSPEILREVARGFASITRLASSSSSSRQGLLEGLIAESKLLAARCLFILQNSLDGELLAQVGGSLLRSKILKGLVVMMMMMIS